MLTAGAERTQAFLGTLSTAKKDEQDQSKTAETLTAQPQLYPHIAHSRIREWDKLSTRPQSYHHSLYSKVDELQISTFLRNIWVAWDIHSILLGIMTKGQTIWAQTHLLCKTESGKQVKV